MSEPSPVETRMLVASFNSWYMDWAALAYQARGALAGAWFANKNIRGIEDRLYRRCWPFHLAMKPFYHLLPGQVEKVQYEWAMPLYDHWLRRQSLPAFHAVQAIAWGAKTPFDLAEKAGALKIFDAPNSHPATYDALERGEQARWSKSVRPGIPAKVIAQAVRDLGRADLVLCPSTWVKESMVRNGVPESTCLLAPFGVDLRIFQPRTAPPARPRFICTGNIRVRKGHPYLFRAMTLLREQYPEAELVCVGTYCRDFDQERLRWKGRFTHIPQLSHPELARAYQACTAFVLPSVEEGFARVIPEAMAAGLPILATHESGATTCVEHGRQGLIFPSGDIDGLARAMARMIEDPELCREMGSNAAATARRNMSWQAYGDRILEAVGRRLRAGRAAPGPAARA
ncbi:MAG: glycosyltransferase family 4 protein [Kiritimatiellia bacterium]